MRPFSALVIDDDEDDFIIITDLIDESFEDCNLIWEPDPDKALAKLCDESIDLCLLDINLGHRSGLDILEEAKNRGVTIPIIMLTGHDNIEIDKQAQSIGAADFLVKNQLESHQVSRSIRYALASREMMEARIERVHAQAESRAKSRFLANLSHELRSPLTSILGYSELLLKDNLNRQSREKASIIHRNGTHLLKLINDVLDLSKIEIGKIEFVEKVFNFENFLTSVYKSLTIVAESKGLNLKLNFSSALPVTIISDATRLRQILINIISNAIKYTNEGSVAAEIHYRLEDTHHFLDFKVVDTGIGIAEDKLKHIFEPFSQIFPEGGTAEGAGLGLTISKELIQAMNGSIVVESTEKIGTCVKYSVQIRLTKTCEIRPFNIVRLDETPEDITSDKFTKLPHIHLLIVDDIKDVREVLGSYADQLEITYQLAENGKDAISKLQKMSHCNAVLMDIHMPLLDGYETAKRIRQTNKNIFLCAMSASNSEDIRRKCRGAGFDTFIAKPITLKQLFSVFGTYIGRDSPIRNFSDQGKEEVGPRKALLIDDNESVVAVVSELLKFCGWDSDMCCRLKDINANHNLARKPYDIIFLDLNMPEGQGKPLVDHVISLFPETPIIIFSGLSPSEDIVALPNVIHFLKKPVTLARLKETLADC